MSRIALALASLVLLAGCSTTQEAAPPVLTQGEIPRGCPLGVPGARVWAEDVPSGIVLSFVSADRPDEMRARARDAAAQCGPGSKLGQGHAGKHGEGGTHGLQMMQAPPAYSGAVDIEGGARIHFVAVDPADVELLRAKLRERADRMNATSCH
jgi:hypothetical protein